MADINVTIKIPSIVSPSGEAWGGRVKHHIKSPPHGVDDDMVIKKIELSGSKENVEAILTFSPLTGMTNKDGKSGGGEANLNETTE
jgi:hypothetical protein